MKLITRDAFQPALITVQRVKYPNLLRLKLNFIALLHSDRNGGPVLIGEDSWRTLSGVIFRVRKTVVWLQVRRFGRDR